MRVDRLLDLSIDKIVPQLQDPEIVCVYEDDPKILEGDPSQIHLGVTGKFGKISIRIGSTSNADEQILTIRGNNCDTTPTFVIPVNGDESWQGKFNEAIQFLTSDPYFCTPDE